MKRIQGHTDIPLNNRGKNQAEKLAHRLQHLPIRHIYASDLKRARQTAEAVANRLNLPVHTCPLLRERYFGEMEGRNREELELLGPQFTIQWGIPMSKGIESLEELQTRIVHRLKELMEKHTDEDLLVVSHGGIINTFIHHVTNGETGTGKIIIGNTAVSTFHYEQGRWRVEDLNDTSHLEK